MKKTIVSLVTIALSLHLVSAQTDSVARSFEQEFNSFQDSITREHGKFISENDSIFLEFLRSSWKSYKMIVPEPVEEVKPMVQPTIQRDSKPVELEAGKPIKRNGSDKKKKEEVDSLNIDLPANFQSESVLKEVNYYGIKARLYLIPGRIPVLNEISNQGIAAFFRNMASGKEWRTNLMRLLQIKYRNHLNDWAYFSLLKDAAAKIFPKKNEQNLFIWYMLLKSSYEVKTGYSGDHILVLLPTRQKVFSTSYVNIGGTDYYLFNSEIKRAQDIYTYNSSYPVSNLIFSFRFDEYPLFDTIPISKSIRYRDADIHLNINVSLIDFYSSMPICSLDTYFFPLLTSDFWAPMDAFFEPLLAQKSNREKVDLLLDFIQSAIPYKTDQEQFGRERYLFAEECLFYPAADCEDRTVLLAQMVKHYTHLPSIALEFPGHVVLGVNFGEDEKGTFIRYQKHKFIICDPTYINAKSGMLPDECKNEKVTIIDWDDSFSSPSLASATADFD